MKQALSTIHNTAFHSMGCSLETCGQPASFCLQGLKFCESTKACWYASTQLVASHVPARIHINKVWVEGRHHIGPILRPTFETVVAVEVRP